MKFSEATLTVSPSELSQGEKEASSGLISLEDLFRVLKAVKEKCPGLPVQAIPWMHLKHPAHPVQGELLNRGMRVDQDNMGWETGGAFGRFSLCLLYAFIMIFRIAGLRFRFRHQLSLLRRRRFTFVGKTWHFGINPTRDGQDFYYGDLQKRLHELGVQILFLYGDPNGRSWRFAPATDGFVPPLFQLPELCLVPFWAPLQVAFQQLRAFIRLRRMAILANDPLLRTVAGLAGRECLSKRISPICLYYWIGKKAVQNWHPKAVIALYEGHGWEQCFSRGAKAADLDCQTIGYQHTVLFRHNLELLCPNGGGSVPLHPDIVLCLGHRTQQMLQTSHDKSILIPFGTFRLPSSQRQRFAGPSPSKPVVLVLPEGHIEEATLLFHRAAETASLLPGYRFILRCHPVLVFEQVRAHLKRDPLGYPNVELSQQRFIEDDFARSSVVLYRGSSAVLYAVLHGLKPLYLKNGLQNDVDPLFELKGWREKVASPQEIAESLLRYASMKGDQATEIWRDAAEYVESYAIPVNDSSINQLLTAIGLLNCSVNK